MISLLPFHPGMLPRLAVLFKACDVYFDTTWAFNPWRTIIANDDETGQVVGFVTSWWDRQPIAWVDILLVHPDYRGIRGMGLAGKLFYNVEALLRKEGVRVIRCVLENEEIIPAIERAGYSNLGTFTVMEKHSNDT